MFPIIKTLFFLVIPRAIFTERDGTHARLRFKKRYKRKLTRWNFELINLNIQLGKAEFLYEDSAAQFYRGNFKGILFFAVYNKNEHCICTFLSDWMIFRNVDPNFQNETFKKYFLERLMRLEIVFMDELKSYSIYKDKKNYFLFEHRSQMVRKFNFSDIDGF